MGDAENGTDLTANVMDCACAGAGEGEGLSVQPGYCKRPCVKELAVFLCLLFCLMFFTFFEQRSGESGDSEVDRAQGEAPGHGAELGGLPRHWVPPSAPHLWISSGQALFDPLCELREQSEWDVSDVRQRQG